MLLLECDVNTGEIGLVMADKRSNAVNLFVR